MTTPTIADRVAALKPLLEKMTPPPWEQRECDDPEQIRGPVGARHGITSTVATASYSLRSNSETEANARGIAATHNLIRDLISDWERSRDRIAELEAVIERCAVLVEDADRQDEIDNGAAATGAASGLAAAIRALKGAKP